MRTLSGTLLTAQKGDGSTPPYVRVHLISAGGTGGTTATYTTSDALNRMPPYHQSVMQREEVYGGVAIVSLLNNDGHFNSLNFKGYSIDIGWGFGTEYSNSPRMFVIGQKEVSVAGQVYTQLLCTDMWNMLGKSEIFAGGTALTGNITGSGGINEKITQGIASGYITWIGADADSKGYMHVAGVVGTFAPGIATSPSISITIETVTPIGAGGSTLQWPRDTSVQDIITALLTGWTTLTKDSDDPSGNLANYKPSYIVPLGTDIRTVISEMLQFTECGMVMKSDGMHAKYIDPAPSADYTYNMSTEHNFLSGSRDRRLVTPNRIAVIAIPPTEGVNKFVGVATDADSYVQLGKYLTRIVWLGTVNSQADADARATAIINRTKAEMNSGELLLPLMNVGQELLDWVTITDERNQSTVYSGRVGMIEREYADGRFGMTIGLGNISSAAGLDDAGVVTPGGSVPTVGSEDLQPSIPSLIPFNFAPAILPVSTNLTFEATSATAIRWYGPGGVGQPGTITFATGGTQAVLAGTLSGIAAKKWIYMIVGNTTLQNTTTFSDTVSATKAIIAIVKPDTSGGTDALIQTGRDELIAGNLSCIAADMGLLTAGEIRVGVGSTSPYTPGPPPVFGNFTGWRMWVEDSIGRFAGFNAGAAQIYLGSDGKLYAGAGRVVLDSSGITAKDSVLRFYQGTTYRGILYAGANLVLGTAAATGISLSAFGDIVLATTGQINLSSSTIVPGYLYPQYCMPYGGNSFVGGPGFQKWTNIYRTNEYSCPLPTTNGALDVIRKIKKPKVSDGDYGTRHYFATDGMPEEMKDMKPPKFKDGKIVEGEFSEPDIELTRVIGVLVGAVRELTEKLDSLEDKVNKGGK